MKKLFTLILMLAFVFVSPLGAFAKEKTYKASFEKASPEEVIKTLQAETGLRFVYDAELLRHAKKPVTCSYSDVTLEQLLNRVISVNMWLAFEVEGDTVRLKMPDVKIDYVRGTISGVVYDAEEKRPLPGVTVMIDGTTHYVSSDIDGRFEFRNVEALNPVLSAYFIGMKPATVKVAPGNQNGVRIDMFTESTVMNEVVVTGYSNISREKMTGAATTVSAEKLNERISLNVLDNLEGRVAGLSTYGGRPIIRGMGTLNGSSNPLLVVDGLPIEGSLNDLNPYDIESVNVLKDAAAAAIYGARAANGILVVTTKNARKQGKIDIDFTASITWYEKRNMDYHDNFYMNTDEHIKAETNYYEWYYLQNDPEYHNDPANNISGYETNLMRGTSEPSIIENAYYQFATGQISRSQLDNFINSLRGNNYAQDYADAMYKRQVIQQYNVSLRSSSEKSRNNLVLNYKSDNSGMINNNLDWLNVFYKGSYDLAKWLTASASINTIFSNSRSAGYDYNSNATTPWAYAPYQPFYNEDGSIRRQYPWYSGNSYWTPETGMKDLGVDPVEEMYNNTQNNRRQNMRYHGELLFKIIEGLTVDTQFIYETESQERRHVATEQSHAARTIYNAFAYMDGDKVAHMTPENGGFLQTDNATGNYWTARGQINYARTFGKHEVSAIAGLEFRETTEKGTRALALGYDDQLQTSATQTVDFGTISQWRSSPLFMSAGGGFPADQFAFSPYLKNGMGLITEVRHRYASGYANAAYTYDTRYNIFGSFRKDYADVFGLNAKYRGKPLWSVGASWNIHNEQFMKGIAETVNFLKLRASYGITGNIFQGATSIMTASSGYINSDTNLPYGTVTSPANPNLKWEQNRTTNVGVDFSLMDYRVNGSIDFYNKKGIDIFHGTNLDPTTGFTSIVANAASILNRGVEISLSAQWFRPRTQRDFTWTTSMTFTYNKNRVLEVENDATLAYQLIRTPFKVGYPVQALWAYRFAGISDEFGSEGQSLFYVDNGGKSHAAQTASIEALEFVGQADPKYIVGMDNMLKWKGLSLNFVLAYYGGHYMFAQARNETFSNAWTTPIASYFKDAWTPENHTDIPGLGKYASTSIGSETTSATNAAHDASFIKLRNLTLGYDLPRKWVSRLGIGLVNIRFQVNNPGALWVANELGVDPETLGLRNPSSYTVGVNINF